MKYSDRQRILKVFKMRAFLELVWCHWDCTGHGQQKARMFSFRLPLTARWERGLGASTVWHEVWLIFSEDTHTCFVPALFCLFPGGKKCQAMFLKNKNPVIPSIPGHSSFKKQRTWLTASHISGLGKRARLQHKESVICKHWRLSCFRKSPCFPPLAPALLTCCG